MAVRGGGARSRRSAVPVTETEGAGKPGNLQKVAISASNAKAGRFLNKKKKKKKKKKNLKKHNALYFKKKKESDSWIKKPKNTLDQKRNNSRRRPNKLLTAPPRRPASGFRPYFGADFIDWGLGPGPLCDGNAITLPSFFVAGADLLRERDFTRAGWPGIRLRSLRYLSVATF